MAKNVIQTKKRVSHFQKTPKDSGGENELFECTDYVSSIIQDMDSKFNHIQSNYSKKGTNCDENQIINPDDSFLNIPLLDMPFPSVSKGNSQSFGKQRKHKNFLLSRKFPLMEKSQKILKQLKHNQNIPKPRAHLAGVPRSPAKSRTKSVAKKKEIQKVKNKVKNNKHSMVPSNHSTLSNIKSSNLNKISKDDLTAKRSVSKKTEDNTSAKGSFRDITPAIDANTETDSALDSGTSDSEFEKFVKKSKKGLQKESSKGRKLNSGKTKRSTKCLKRKKLHEPEQKNTYDCDNVAKSSRSSKISPFKRQKRVQNITDFNDLNCSEQEDIPDMPTRDSSSESDDDSIAISMTRQVVPKICEVKPNSETTVLSGANSSQSYPNLSVLDSINYDLVSSKIDTQLEDSVQLEVMHTDKTEIFSGANLQLSGQNLPVSESHLNSDKVQSEFLNKNIVNAIKIEQNSVPSNLVIDLCDSDDECNNRELNDSRLLGSENMLSTVIENSNKSFADSDSEESDLEIIEIKKPVQIVGKNSVSVFGNASDSSNSRVSNEKQLGNTYEVMPLIKTEDLDNKFENILPVAKSEIDDKHDVVYRTDICLPKMISEQKTAVSQSSKTPNVPSKEYFQENPDLAAVKQEIDDDIIILDSVHSVKVMDPSNLSSAKAKNIKLEPSTSESKLKLFDPIDSNLMTDETNEWEKEIQDVIPVSSVELLEWCKMEFETYMEMKQANADVEASLKNLQARQAQKMRYVRNLLRKCIKGNDDTKSLMGQQGQNLKDTKNFVSVDVQNNCDVTPNNSFSPNPSTSMADIKPDVNKLKEEMQPADIKPKIESDQDNLHSRKYIPKTESDNKQTLKLLNEKCSECGKNAVAACQRCAKVFFCSHECGRKFWIDGHVKVCGSK